MRYLSRPACSAAVVLAAIGFVGVPTARNATAAPDLSDFVSSGFASSGFASSGFASVEEIDYAKYDVRVVDTKGVSTEATGFGYLTGPNILMARRGEGEADIPFRLIRSIEIGTFVPENRVAPCKVVLKSGKTVDLEVDNIEENRLMGGSADFGEYRIRFGKIRRLELLRLTHADANG